MRGNSKGEFNKLLKENNDPAESLRPLIVPTQQGITNQQRIIAPNLNITLIQHQSSNEDHNSDIENEGQKSECSTNFNENDERNKDFNFKKRKQYKKDKNASKRERQLKKQQNNKIQFQNIFDKKKSYEKIQTQQEQEYQNFLSQTSFEQLRKQYRQFFDKRKNAKLKTQSERIFSQQKIEIQYPKWKMIKISEYTQWISVYKSLYYRPYFMNTHSFKVIQAKQMVQKMIDLIRYYYYNGYESSLPIQTIDKKKVVVFIVMTGKNQDSSNQICDTKKAICEWCLQHQLQLRIRHTELIDRIYIDVYIEG